MLKDEILPSGETVAVILNVPSWVLPSVRLTSSRAVNTTWYSYSSSPISRFLI